MRRKSPTIQQWIDSIPNNSEKVNNTNKVRGWLTRDESIQSNSSVESVLELRKADPEAVLLGLGFGPPAFISRIPKRFLQPSKVNGIDITKFLNEQIESDDFPANCLQVQSSPNSPTNVCEFAMSVKKNSF